MGPQQDAFLSALSPTRDAGSRLAAKEKFYFHLLIQLRNVFSANVTLKPNTFQESKHQKLHRGKGEQKSETQHHEKFHVNLQGYIKLNTQNVCAIEAMNA